MAPTVTSEQLAIIVDYMERFGDIAAIFNSPQGRVTRQQHWVTLSNLLNQVGGGARKSVDKWMKTWCDLKHRTKKKLSSNQEGIVGTGGGPNRNISISHIEMRVQQIIGNRAIFGGGVEEVGLNLNDTTVHAIENIDHDYVDVEINVAPSQELPSTSVEMDTSLPVMETGADAVSVEESLEVTTRPEPSSQSQIGNVRKRRRTRQLQNKENSFDRAATVFASLEEKRLKLDEEKLEFQKLKEKNLHERELRKIDLHQQQLHIQIEVLNVLKGINDKLNTK